MALPAFSLHRCFGLPSHKNLPPVKDSFYFTISPRGSLSPACLLCFSASAPPGCSAGSRRAVLLQEARSGYSSAGSTDRLRPLRPGVPWSIRPACAGLRRAGFFRLSPCLPPAGFPVPQPEQSIPGSAQLRSGRPAMARAGRHACCLRPAALHGQSRAVRKTSHVQRQKNPL